MSSKKILNNNLKRYYFFPTTLFATQQRARLGPVTLKKNNNQLLPVRPQFALTVVFYGNPCYRKNSPAFTIGFEIYRKPKSIEGRSDTKCTGKSRPMAISMYAGCTYIRKASVAGTNFDFDLTANPAGRSVKAGWSLYFSN